MKEQVRTKFLGDFGEYLLAWHLRSKYGINARLVKGEGIDLLCRDEDGVLFPKGQYVAISVKTRERREDRIHESVNADWDKIEKASERWGAKPYFAYIRIAPESGLITFFLLPVSEARTYGKNFNVKKTELELLNILFEMKFNGYRHLREWTIREGGEFTKEEAFHKDKNVGITLVKDGKILKVYSSETVGPVSFIRGFFKHADSKPVVNVTNVEEQKYFTDYRKLRVYIVKGRDRRMGFRLVISLEDAPIKDVHKGKVLRQTTSDP